MKKSLLFFLLIYKSVLLGQTVLNSYPLNLHNSLENGQALNVEDVKTHDIYVFAADDKNINILKYNKSLFLTNQFTDTIKYVEKRTLIGHSFSEDGNPTLYWGSRNLRNFHIIKYYLGTKISKPLNFDFPDNIEYLITTFQKDNLFYVLAKEKNQQHLLLYEFDNGKCEIKMFDFSAFSFQNAIGQNLSFSALIRYFPIQKIETNDFNTLDKSAKLIKMYVLDKHMLLTFDYNQKKTQVFDLNLETTAVTEKNFDQPALKNDSKTSNSFYSKNKLYQINANKEELLFDIKDFDSEKTIKSASISKNDTIPFTNSLMFLQMNNEKPQKLKTVSKFLQRLSPLSAGVSVLENNNAIYITFGGFVEHIYTDTFYPPRDYMTFQDFDNPAFQNYTQSKMVFFDSTLNSKYEFINNNQQEPLAIDNISYFLSITKNVSLQNILKLKDYYILSYYDTVSQQYIMRKFTDGLILEDNGNPIMNKSQFSKQASFGTIKPR